MREAKQSTKREGKKEWQGLSEGEKASHPHLIACQSTKIKKDPSTLLVQ